MQRAFAPPSFSLRRSLAARAPARRARPGGELPDSGNTSLWGGGSNYQNPGHGGVGGDHDGYLRVSADSLGRFGTRSGGLTYVGDWSAAGITRVQLWLNDVGADDALEIHFALGPNANRWLYTVGFDPPNNQWAPFTVI